MTRCLPHLLRPCLLALCASLTLLASAPQALAQDQIQMQRGRTFPAGVQRGTVQFLDLYEVQLNGRKEALTPGVRVHNDLNMVVLTSALVGQTFSANFLRDFSGAVREIWLLSPDEARAPLPKAPGS